MVSSYIDGFDILEKSLHLIDGNEDAANYSRERGMAMPMQWPQFEQWNGADLVSASFDNVAEGGRQGNWTVKLISCISR